MARAHFEDGVLTRKEFKEMNTKFKQIKNQLKDSKSAKLFFDTYRREGSLITGRDLTGIGKTAMYESKSGTKIVGFRIADLAFLKEYGGGPRRPEEGKARDMGPPARRRKPAVFRKKNPRYPEMHRDESYHPDDESNYSQDTSRGSSIGGYKPVGKLKA